MFDVENMPKFLFAYFMITLIILAYVVVRLVLFQKAFVQGKIKVICRVEIDAVTGAEIVVMSLVNRSYNDINVRGFGFKYYQQDFDYMAQYCKSIDLRPSDKLYIQSRDTLEVRIDLDSIKVKLNTTSVSKFKAYVIDNMGNYIVKNAKDVERYIETFFKQAEFIEKVENSDDKTQGKYYAKQAKYDKRIKSILDHSIKTRLEIPIVSSDEETPILETPGEVETPTEETIIDKIEGDEVEVELYETKEPVVEETIEEDNEEAIEEDNEEAIEEK